VRISAIQGSFRSYLGLPREGKYARSRATQAKPETFIICPRKKEQGNATPQRHIPNVFRELRATARAVCSLLRKWFAWGTDARSVKESATHLSDHSKMRSIPPHTRGFFP
jgi:hypothetical protein